MHFDIRNYVYTIHVLCVIESIKKSATKAFIIEGIMKHAAELQREKQTKCGKYGILRNASSESMKEKVREIER